MTDDERAAGGAAMTTPTKGVRMPDDSEPFCWPNGGYGRHFGFWYGKAPTGDLANFANHEVTEHDDGTISVTPSVAIRQQFGGPDLYHGYLTAGVWRDA